MINICFHGIGTPQRELEPGEAGYWISEDLFDTVLEEVSGRDDVRLSFDDSNVSDVEIGLEGLLRHDLSATFFVIAGRLDQPGSLSAEQVRQLRSQGMTIGSHGMDHVPWRSLSEAAQRRELVDARTILSEVVGEPVDEAALPLGRYERRTLGRLRELGYAHVHTSDRLPSKSSAWLQHRFSLRSDDTADSVRNDLLTPGPWARRLLGRAKSGVKQLR
ncbi:polysaccharide deacetylase family protein [Microlunatus spumicola]|uniref:Polysaccharide deacetylase family protein n=1 Tax=Microlunatus spumicola TaxID=81499 RepID=A0ABP6YB24_9ACTN